MRRYDPVTEQRNQQDVVSHKKAIKTPTASPSPTAEITATPEIKNASAKLRESKSGYCNTASMEFVEECKYQNIRSL
ncbi:MAG: hypothetical protein ACLTJ5_14700 [Clostridium sp.]